MLAKRIIPCLDVKDGRTVKGTNFVGLRDAGDPVELATRYCVEGADELTLLDISATNESRRTLVKMVRDVAAAVNIPFTVGGGIASVEDIGRLLESGADKVSINTAAFRDPDVIREAARNFGSQCIVLSVDAKLTESKWRVYLNGGRVETDADAIEWIKRGVDLGAGEILLTSINADGTKAGFDIALTNAVASAAPVPVVASGGAGTMQDFEDIFTAGRADAALAASVFHYGQIEIGELKNFLSTRGVAVRI
jgi:imidazole glycerol-phosphate synthase subunit HisF